MFESSAPQGLVPCNVCGQRPGTIGVLFATPGGRRTVTVCEQCAQQLANASTPGAPLASVTRGRSTLPGRPRAAPPRSTASATI